MPRNQNKNQDKNQNKTKPTAASVKAYIAAIEDEERRADCETLLNLMAEVTKQKPVMWGDSIVGYGSYHYKYASGREGDWCVTGFSSRKRDISVYLMASGKRQEELLARLGKHKMAVSCLSIRRLSDIDLKILKRLVAGSVAEIRRRYG